MAYEKLNLTDGTVLNEEHLAHIEAGIANSGGIGTVSDSCIASGEYAHAEGENTKATYNGCHAEGCDSKATYLYSHAEGLHTEASGRGSHSEGEYTKATGEAAHAENYYTEARGYYSHAEGKNTIARSEGQHVQGKYNIEDAAEKYAHIVGNGYHIVENGTITGNVRSNAHTVDWNGLGWFAGGLKVGGTGQDDAEAQDILPSAVQYVEQALTPEQQHQARKNIRCGSVGEVSDESVASGEYSHAEGFNTRAAGYCAHAEGYSTEATNYYAHSEGRASEAAGEASHAEGDFTRASGRCSHTEGDHTVANGEAQHVQGRRNIEDNDNRYAHIVGNGGYVIVEGPDGEQIPFEDYSNAHTLDWAGVPWFQGRVQCGGNAQDDGAQTVMLNGDTEVTLTDRTTGVKYNLYIDNGKLMMEEVS